ncbi:MAG: tryptophan synthase subunit alpha [candidate division KSB1 bacterium]|nr:tryptophan synthase subunit alpha [candidate division KSB1 bacterium]
MNRLDKQFQTLKGNDKAGVFFITAGDPDIQTTLNIMSAMADSGADVIELGMPFSDPMAEGPVIQRSSARALINKITLMDIFKLVERFRQNYDTPVVMMGYCNPVFQYGIEPFVRDAKSHGVDGFIIADLPFEEGETMETVCRRYGLALIYLLAPDFTERSQEILKASSGFVYVISQYSTTGAESADHVAAGTLTALRASTELPVCVGFGISSIETAKDFSKHADGVIIGSWLIREMEKASDKPETAGNLVRCVKSAICMNGK